MCITTRRMVAATQGNRVSSDDQNDLKYLKNYKAREIRNQIKYSSGETLRVATKIPKFKMVSSHQIDQKRVLTNQKMFKFILASLVLVMLAISLSECMKRTQYHEQVSGWEQCLEGIIS